jgi:hypothetical protein
MVGHQGLELFARILAALIAVVQQAVRPARRARPVTATHPEVCAAVTK